MSGDGKEQEYALEIYDPNGNLRHTSWFTPQQIPYTVVTVDKIKVAIRKTTWPPDTSPRRSYSP